MERRGYSWGRGRVKENVVVCGARLCNPFRESAERGTQTPEWGKNSASSPPHPPSFSLLSPLSSLPTHPVSHGSRLRGNQAKHKLGRRIAAGNIYKPWNLREEPKVRETEVRRLVPYSSLLTHPLSRSHLPEREAACSKFSSFFGGSNFPQKRAESPSQMQRAALVIISSLCIATNARRTLLWREIVRATAQCQREIIIYVSLQWLSCCICWKVQIQWRTSQSLAERSVNDFRRCRRFLRFSGNFFLSF